MEKKTNNRCKDKGKRCEYQFIFEQTNKPNDGLVPTKILEWNPDNLAKTVTDSENYKKHLIPTTYSKGTIIMGSMTAPNLYSQLKIFAKAFPGMPVPNFVDTRDNKIVIHNGKHNGLPVFSYTYAGGTGELLSFGINTKYTQTVTSSKRDSIDPDDKSINSEVDQCIPTKEKEDCQWDLMVPEWTSDYNKPKEVNQVDALFMAKYPPRGQKKPEQSQSPNPGMVKRTVYNSKEEAREILSANIELTDAEVKQFNDFYKKKFEKVSNPKTKEDYHLLTKTMNEFRDLLVFRKAIVYVDPNDYVPNRLKGRLTTIAGDYWQAGYRALENTKGIRIIQKPDGTAYRDGDIYNPKGENVMVEMELAIPIPGVRVLSSPNFTAMGQSSIQDVIASTINQIEGKGRFVGNPAMESSQNMEIKNIGSKYSGIWYSKEVTHIIDHSGYHTEVSYRKKSQNLLVNKITSKVNTQKIFQETQKIAEESYRTGAWLYPSKVLSEVEKYRADSWSEPGQSGEDNRTIGAFQLNPDEPSKWVIYESSVDFETGQPITKKLKDINL